MVSDPAQPGPRFRLSYENLASDTIGIIFEIAMPDKPEAFATHIVAKAYQAPKQ